MASRDSTLFSITLEAEPTQLSSRATLRSTPFFLSLARSLGSVGRAVLLLLRATSVYTYTHTLLTRWLAGWLALAGRPAPITRLAIC